MKPLTRFESSVLGAVGQAVGDRCTVVEGLGEPRAAVADVLEEPDGTGFVVQLEDVVDGAASAQVTLEEPGGERLRGVEPFGDAEGHFVIEVPLEGDRFAFFVAHGALVDPPPRAVVRVVLRDESGAVLGHTAFALRPQPAAPVTFATYAQPFADLAWAVAMADGLLDPAEQHQIGLQLQTVFGADDDAVEVLSKPPLGTAKVSALAVSLRCRFADLDAEELFFALIGVAASDGQVSPAEIRVLQKVAKRLDVPEKSWKRWAFRMGVELPDDTDSTDLRLDARPALVVLAEAHGQRVPSMILQLDRAGQDRRNVFATLSLLSGILAVVVWVGSVAVALTPYATFLVFAVAPIQALTALLATVLGWLGLRVARDADGAGHGAATTGLSLGIVSLVLGAVWWLVVCLGVSTTVYWDQDH